MNIFKWIVLFLILSLVVSPVLLAEKIGKKPFSSNDDRPNILFILVDDLGRELLSAYGSDHFETPNIDRIADEGIKFNRFFVNPFCTPSRSELLTGRYPFATGTTFPIWHHENHIESVLDVSEPSFARQLQQSGYATAIAGKWQLSFLRTQDWVHDFGFDTYNLWQIVSEEGERTTRFYNPYYRQDGRVIADEISHRYGPDVQVDFLIDFMDNHRGKKPFMAYYTALQPHWPWFPTPDSEDQTMPQDDGGPGHFVGDPKFFPDNVHRLDKDVGRLIDSLEEMGIVDNTIVIFTSDNGTDQRLVNTFNNGIEVPGGKATLTDRGSMVPLFIRWPGKIMPGSVDNEIVELADIFPTLVEITGAEMPDQEIHGKSFAERIIGEGDTDSYRPWIHLQMNRVRNLRTDDWYITEDGIIKKVQPYPVDAIEYDLQDVSEDERKMLRELERELKNLPVKWERNKNDDNR